MIQRIPDPNVVFPNSYGTTCFLKNVITAPNILVGDYTYYDDPVDPTGFEKNNVLFNWPEFGDRLIIGKFCSIASGTQFLMNTANHRISSVTTYPFHVFGGAWEEHTPPHLEQLPFKGDTVVGNDVWIGRKSSKIPQETVFRGSHRFAFTSKMVGFCTGKVGRDSSTIVQFRFRTSKKAIAGYSSDPLNCC